MNFPYEKEARKPHIEVTHATPQLVKFTLTDTDISIANAMRRIILAEVPTMAIELVSVEANESVLFDEFITHRLGLLPLACHRVGDIPPDEKQGFKEHKKCDCFDGCPQCTCEFTLCVTNSEDRVRNVTHFDIEDSGEYRRDDLGTSEDAKIMPLPRPDPTKMNIDGTVKDEEIKDNGILLCKLKKDQSISMVCQARKGKPQYHAKFSPVATCCMRYQQIIKLEDDMVNTMDLDEKVEFVNVCPRQVFALEQPGDKVVVDKLNDCIYCDECVAKALAFGKKGMVSISHNQNMFHFIVESVTPEPMAGPRSVIDVVRAAFRVFDYKLSLFLQDTWGDEIKEWLPREPAPEYRPAPQSPALHLP